MPETVPRQPRKAGKRQAILSAARSIVSEVGFHETSIAAVASASGVSTGSIYSYFSSKAELMAEIVATVSARELKVLREIALSEAPVAERLAAAVEVFARRAFANRRLAWSMIAEPADPAVDATRLAYRREIAGIFRSLVLEGGKEGAFRPVDPDAAAAMIVGGFMEALIGPLSPERPITPERGREIAAALADLSLAALIDSEGQAA
ncbi:Transcriptional regulator, TetR family [Hyphomicrobiales bacterium]|nr:Transcriptional regulator, TetR family [Hyphomicrobiales bacterium]CAH1697733.1 Transcriptional regulator, TetR family [Hyphomicrobiales bacterium]CAI0347380.1 Transcriptional regulator, TetR family [Hyphomicrobiales bacterium]